MDFLVWHRSRPGPGCSLLANLKTAWTAIANALSMSSTRMTLPRSMRDIDAYGDGRGRPWGQMPVLE